jgi:hypothetical protein
VMIVAVVMGSVTAVQSLVSNGVDPVTPDGVPLSAAVYVSPAIAAIIKPGTNSTHNPLPRHPARVRPTWLQNTQPLNMFEYVHEFVGPDETKNPRGCIFCVLHPHRLQIDPKSVRLCVLHA